MSDLDEAKEREAFEAKTKAMYVHAQFERTVDGGYANSFIHGMWEGWRARASQPSAPAWIADQIPLTAIHNAIRSLERDQARCVEWRDQSAQGSASFAFHNQAVAQCNADITALISLLPPAEQ